MQKELFSNTVFIATTAQTVIQTLLNPDNLLRWIPDIKQVIVDDDRKISIQRSSQPKNQELIIKKTTSNIEYQITQTDLAYTIVFVVEEHTQEQCLVHEIVYLKEESSKLDLAIKLGLPFAKYAFKHNLNNLAAMLEIN